MFPRIEYYEPKDLLEACTLKAELNGKVVAGGTDVYVDLHAGKAFPHVIDIKKLPELQDHRETEEAIILGALKTHRSIEESVFFQKYYSCLFEGCSQVGSVQIRVRGTLGGNICNAVPSADSIGPLLALGTDAVITNGREDRVIPLKDFFTGPKKTVLAPDEILKELVIPKAPERSGSCYLKYTRRRAMDLALCGYCLFLTLDEEDTIVNVRAAMTTAAPTPIRGENAEAYLLGKRVSEVDTEVLGQMAVKDGRPRSSWRSSAEFRFTLFAELAGRCFRTAVERAHGQFDNFDGKCGLPIRWGWFNAPEGEEV